METKSKLARSQDGTGGLYWALENERVLEDLERCKVILQNWDGNENTLFSNKVVIYMCTVWTMFQ